MNESRSRFLFRIELLGIEPTIWRRFFVPANINLDDFNDVVQVAMGWGGSHLWQFTAGKRRFIPVQDDDDDLDPAEYRLWEIVSRKRQVIRYLYDFGDGWDHKIQMEDSQYFLPDGDTRIAGCLDGARACPPEDIGGIYGYYDFCEIMSNPESERYQEMLDWYCGWYEGDDPEEIGTPFNPEHFDVEAVNLGLAELEFEK